MADDDREASSFLERKIELAYLTAFYGGLLTDKQKEVLSMYCEEDMSFGEIARETGVSRQGVYNMLSRTALKLFHLEESLGMAARFQRLHDGMTACVDLLDRGDTQQARNMLVSIMQSDMEDQEDARGL